MADMSRYVRWYDKETRRWLYEHRVVASRMLDRPLLSSEVVHHKDGNWLNNAPENLEIVTRASHMSIHMRKYELCILCGRTHVAKGLCHGHQQQLYYWKTRGKRPPGPEWATYPFETMNES